MHDTESFAGTAGAALHAQDDNRSLGRWIRPGGCRCRFRIARQPKGDGDTARLPRTPLGAPKTQYPGLGMEIAANTGRKRVNGTWPSPPQAVQVSPQAFPMQLSSASGITKSGQSMVLTVAKGSGRWWVVVLPCSLRSVATSSSNAHSVGFAVGAVGFFFCDSCSLTGSERGLPQADDSARPEPVVCAGRVMRNLSTGTAD